MDCGPRCWRWIEAQSGRRATLKRLISLCKTDENGTTFADMIAGGRALGYHCTLKQNMTWAGLQHELRKGRYVIPAWWTVLNAGVASKPDGHYSVITKAARGVVTLYDPDADDIISVPREMWWSHWYDFEIIDGVRTDFIRSAVIVWR